MIADHLKISLERIGVIFYDHKKAVLEMAIAFAHTGPPTTTLKAEWTAVETLKISTVRRHFGIRVEFFSATTLTKKSQIINIYCDVVSLAHLTKTIAKNGNI